LLSADPLASVEANVASPDVETELKLSLSDLTAPLVLGIRVNAAGDSTLDPRAPRVSDSQGADVGSVASDDDLIGSTSGQLLVELSAGEHTIHVGGEDGTVGAFQADVFVPGDIDQSGSVELSEMHWATAAVTRHYAFGNHIAARVFARLGVNMRAPLYDANTDADQDGDIDGFDYRLAVHNAGSGSVSLALIGDDGAPSVDIQTTNDTGRHDDDGVTNDLGMTIDLTVTDASLISSVQVTVDDNPLQEQLTAEQVNTQNEFQFSLGLAELQALAGNTGLINNGWHTLKVVAVDELGHSVDPPVEFQFEFDTIAPAAPGTPDLLPDSDTGTSNTDNLTNDNTPDFEVDAESASLVELFSDQVTGSIGQGEASSPATITSSELQDGDHVVTAAATDLAGNTSNASGQITVTIDTAAPAQPQFDFDPPTGEFENGNPLTTDTPVDLAGTTEADAAVTLTVGTEEIGTETADASGGFGFSDVTVPHGRTEFTVSAADAAGNTSQFSQTMTRNSGPAVIVSSTPIDFAEDERASDTITLSNLLSDADLPDGDTLTFSIVSNSNTELVSTALSGSSTNPNLINTTLTLSYVLHGNGEATITVRATDSLGATADATVVVTISAVNDAPTFDIPAEHGVQEDGPPQTVPGFATDILPGGGQDEANQVLTFNVTNDNPSLFSQQPSIDANGTLTYTPAAGITGDANVTVELSDDGGTDNGGDDTSGATFVLHVVDNLPPTAEDDPSYTATANTVETVGGGNDGLIGNDTDPEDDPLTAVAETIQSDMGATVTIRADGGFDYDPRSVAEFTELAEGETAEDKFRYTVSDGNGGEDEGEATVTVTGVNEGPELAVIENVTLQAGSPLHIRLDASDIDGDALTYEIVANDAPGLVSTSFPETGSRNMRVSVEYTPEGEPAETRVQGDMVYRLFENRVKSITDKIIEFVNDGAYDGHTFHRIINNFMIQAEGDFKPNYDDAFHVDLQHNSTGLLSLATPGTDDENGSGYFSTEGPSRHLDMNHSIFGGLLEGEDVRAAVSDVDVEANPTRPTEISKPVHPVDILGATIETDNQNEMLMISAPEHSLGEANITVRVSDGTAFAERTFHVDVVDDTFNSLPFLGPVTDTQGNELATLQTTVGTPLQFVLTSEDVEGDAVFYDSVLQDPSHGTVTTNSTTGLTTYTPPAQISGNSQTFQIAVGVRPAQFTNDQLQLQGIGMGVQDTQILEVLVTAS
jgi:cyclophilin family peptidyl-prolyl cis-trans isomerase